MMSQHEAGSASQNKPEISAPSGLRLALDMGPLLVFFGVYAYAGIYAATMAFIPVTIAALAATRYAFGKVGVLPLVTGIFVVIFGGLTVVLSDDMFIKIKPTLVYLLFAGVALVGLAFNWVVWKQLFGEVFQLTDEGWRKMQLRWGCFFLVLALLNEFIWRTLSTDVWVAFKVFGVLPLTFVFALAQLPLIHKYAPAGSTAKHSTSANESANGAS
jgi:intracellular septation protein